MLRSASTSKMQGHVDYETGVVRLRFGAFVVAAGNESQIWYSAEAVPRRQTSSWSAINGLGMRAFGKS